MMQIAPTVEYLEYLLAVKCDVKSALVEAIDIMHLSVRVPSAKVNEVEKLLHDEWFFGWKIDVSQLGYCERFINKIYIFG